MRAANPAVVITGGVLNAPSRTMFDKMFNRQGEPIKDFRWSGDEGLQSAPALPTSNFHDLRSTAVRDMRRDGVPQVVRMEICGHKTDSMERRYNIVDADDMNMAKRLMGKR